MSTFLQDTHYGCRLLQKSPVFAVIAVATLALGIAADTTLFSVVNGVLLSPIPYPHSEQLVSINSNEAVPQIPVSYPNFLDWQRIDPHAPFDMGFRGWPHSSTPLKAIPE